MRTGKLADERYPAISDLRKKGRKMIPHFAWEYLDSGTGEEEAMLRSQAGFRNITLVPEFMKGSLQPSVDVELFGQKYDAPIGIPPIGYTSLMWPGAEMMFARTAAKNRIVHCLSTMASDTPENCGPAARRLWMVSAVSAARPRNQKRHSQTCERKRLSDPCRDV